MTGILLACLAMTIKDALGTVLTIAEAKNYAALAGASDALGDLAQIAITVLGAGVVLAHGLTAYAIVLLAALTATSFVGTLCYTKIANRLLPATEQRVDADRG